MSAAPRIKICGITSIEDAIACCAEGVDALGVNMVPGSPRRVDEETATALVRAIGGRCLSVGIVADVAVDAMLALRTRVGFTCLQLHGDETPEVVAALLPHALKAVRVGSEEDIGRAASMPGEFVLVDSKSAHAKGGTGRLVDFRLVAPLSQQRKIVLAGGLTPENVAQAIAEVHPYGVDVASGVERSPGVKDIDRIRAFVAAVRGNLN